MLGSPEDHFDLSSLAAIQDRHDFHVWAVLEIWKLQFAHVKSLHAHTFFHVY